MNIYFLGQFESFVLEAFNSSPTGGRRCYLEKIVFVDNFFHQRFIDQLFLHYFEDLADFVLSLRFDIFGVNSK